MTSECEQKWRALREEWLERVTPALLELGLFAELGELPQARAIAELKARYRAERFPLGWEEFDDPPIAELAFAALDRSRIWAEEPYDDLCGLGTAISIVQSISRISRGAFRPLDLECRWLPDTCQVCVTFVHEGTPVTLQADYPEAFVNLEILPMFKRLIARSGLELALVEYMEEMPFMIALREDELPRFRERGWPFIAEPQAQRPCSRTTILALPRGRRGSRARPREPRP